MRFRLRFLLIPLLAFCFLAAARKPDITIRFHCAANVRDGSPFASSLILPGNPPQTAYIQKVPAVSEREIDAIFPFEAADGTMGCTFKLNFHGKTDLDALSVENKGTVMVALVNGRPAAAMLIDARISDGIITIPSGLSDEEILSMRKIWRVMGTHGKQ